MECDWQPTAETRAGRFGVETRLVCIHCNQEEWSHRPPELTHRICKRLEYNKTMDAGGAGTELHAALKTCGYDITPDCLCASRIKAMNERGTVWCKNNVGLIVEWLRQEAARRNISYIKAPGWRMVARKIILKAIMRAENNV